MAGTAPASREGRQPSPEEGDTMAGTLAVIYFSPTHTSRTVAQAVAEGLGPLGLTARDVDLTPAAARGGLALELGEGDVAVVAFPVYAGRVPRVVAEALAGVSGGGALAVPVAVYGNRDFDDALVEAADLLEAAGFGLLAAGAFVGEHSFTRLVGTDRPDAADVEAAVALGAAAADKLAALGGARPEPLALPGNRPYTEYKADLPFTPLTTDACTECGACARVCPMDAIDPADVRVVDARCITCNACVKICPVAAKTFAGTPVEGVAHMLQENCAARREPQAFL